MVRTVSGVTRVAGVESGRDIPAVPDACAGGALVRQQTTEIAGIRYRIVDAIKVCTPIDKVTWEHSRATVTDGGVLRYVAARLEPWGARDGHE